MIHLSYNGELYSYDNKTSTTVSSVTSIPVTIHPYVSIEGAKLFYSQVDTEGIVDINNNVAEIPGTYLVTGELQVALKLDSSELSNLFTINVTMISSSGEVTDDDIQFTLDNKKRLILVPGSQNMLAVQLDNESEVVTFKLPRYQENIDLSNKIPCVNYKRPQANDLGRAVCNIVSEKTTEDTIYVSWLVDSTATQYFGTLQFQLEFSDSDGYRWQSQIAEIPVLESLYNTGVTPHPPSGDTIIIDSELSDTSENPVQNRVIKRALDTKVNADQGVANAGKFLMVGNDGKVTVVSLSSASGVSF